MARQYVPPIEVAIVSKPNGALGIFVVLANTLLAAVALMYAVPLAHLVFGAPQRAPGYLHCFFFILAARFSVFAIFKNLPQLPTERVSR